MFHTFIFSGMEMTFTCIEKVFVYLEYARTQSNKTAQRAFIREFPKTATVQIWKWRKRSEAKASESPS